MIDVQIRCQTCNHLLIPISDSCTKLLERLLADSPEFVSTHDLARALWPHRRTATNRMIATLRVHIFLLRRVVGHIGLAIESRQGKGYRIIQSEDENEED